MFVLDMTKVWQDNFDNDKMSIYDYDLSVIRSYTQKHSSKYYFVTKNERGGPTEKKSKKTAEIDIKVENSEGIKEADMARNITIYPEVTSVDAVVAETAIEQNLFKTQILSHLLGIKIIHGVSVRETCTIMSANRTAISR